MVVSVNLLKDAEVEILRVIKKKIVICAQDSLEMFRNKYESLILAQNERWRQA